MAEYDSLEDEIKAYKRHRIANSIFTPLYAIVTPFIAIASANNLSSEDGDSTKGIICAMIALYTAYRAFRGVKKQRALNKTIAELQEEKKMSLEEKVE